MQAVFTYIFGTKTHEKELRKRDAEILKLKELVKRKLELEKRDKEIKRLQGLLTDEVEESDEDEEVESEEEVEESDEEYEPSEEEEESDEEYVPQTERRGRPQHCSFCGGPRHKITRCYHRSDLLIKNLRLNEDALRDNCP